MIIMELYISLHLSLLYKVTRNTFFSICSLFQTLSLVLLLYIDYVCLTVFYSCHKKISQRNKLITCKSTTLSDMSLCLSSGCISRKWNHMLKLLWGSLQLLDEDARVCLVCLGFPPNFLCSEHHDNGSVRDILIRHVKFLLLMQERGTSISIQAWSRGWFTADKTYVQALCVFFLNLVAR